MKEYKLIVAGGRDFNDYPFLSKVLKSAIIQLDADTKLTIVSGMARGADALGVRYAREHGIEFYAMPADWDQFGRSAGYRRNAEMAAIADGLIAFWDGQSKGTRHMIEIMRQAKKFIVTIKY